MIATQAALGEIGEKPTTELSWSFDSMVEGNGFHFGLNDEGVHILNQGDTDEGTTFTSSFTLATSDFGVSNPKKSRYLYLGLDFDMPLELQMSFDNQAWISKTVTPKKTGLQRVKVSIGGKKQGRYVKVRVNSDYPFRIDSMDGNFITRSSGIGGY